MEKEKKKGKGRPRKVEGELTYCITYSASPKIVKWLDSYTKRHLEYPNRSALITAAVVFFKEAKEKARAK